MRDQLRVRDDDRDGAGFVRVSAASPRERRGARTVFSKASSTAASVGAICVTEPGTRAPTRRGFADAHQGVDAARSEWVVNGRKRYISNAGCRRRRTSRTASRLRRTAAAAGLDRRRGARRRPQACRVSAPLHVHGTAGLRRRRGRGSTTAACRADHLLGAAGVRHARSCARMFNFERDLFSAGRASASRGARSTSRRAHAQQSRDAFGARSSACKELIWHDIAEMSWRFDAAELLDVSRREALRCRRWRRAT